MAERLPLSALLSQALVAFTIELDNAWESAMPHRTSRHGGARHAPYAASLRQWSNFMRVLDENGLTVAELERRTRAKPQLDAMRRWGYVTIAPDPADERQRPPAREHLVVPTEAGRRAQDVWRPLPEAIEGRWRERFGAEEVGELRGALEALRAGLGLDLPQFLTDGYGGSAAEPAKGTPPEDTAEPLPLSALLSQALHAFALEYERESAVSLSYSANILRVLDEDGATMAQLPCRSGVAIEPIRVAIGILEKRRFLTTASAEETRGKHVRLTRMGSEARAVYGRMPDEIEARWGGRFGTEPVSRLRARLEALATEHGTARAPLWLGLDPPPGTWRSKVRRPDVLPHFPMPRQSGHPDGA